MSAPLRVLIVEDSEDDAQLLLRELAAGGFEVAAHKRVDTAEQMRAALAAGAWDIVLCDYRMPRFSSPAALALLRETGLDLPFVIVSGAIDDARTDPRIFRPDLLGEMRAAACVPLRVRDEIVGTVSLARNEKSGVMPPGFDDGQMRILEAVADIAANAIGPIRMSRRFAISNA